MEALASVQLESAEGERAKAPVSPLPMSIRRARRCGDHLGGELAGELYHRLVVAGWLEGSGRQLMVSERGGRSWLWSGSTSMPWRRISNVAV